MHFHCSNPGRSPQSLGTGSHPAQADSWASSGHTSSKNIGTAQKEIATPQYSHVVPHRSTDWAVRCLTLQIGRDAVLSSSYGSNWKSLFPARIRPPHLGICRFCALRNLQNTFFVDCSVQMKARQMSSLAQTTEEYTYRSMQKHWALLTLWI